MTAGDAVKNLLRAAIQQPGLAARAYDRPLNVSRTIADQVLCQGSHALRSNDGVGQER